MHLTPLDLKTCLGEHWEIRQNPAHAGYQIQCYFTASQNFEVHRCATDEQVFRAVLEAKREALKTLMDGLEKEYEKLR